MERLSRAKALGLLSLPLLFREGSGNGEGEAGSIELASASWQAVQSCRFMQPSHWQKRTWMVAAALLILLLSAAGAILVLVFRDQLFPLPSPQAVRDSVNQLLQTIPAPVYFLALVVLPAIGAPLTFFYLTALPVLGSAHPLAGILLVWLGLALNMVLSRWLALGILHPVIEWVIRHRHLRIPRIRRETEWELVLALRVSPLPFVLQNYLLSLGRARWRTYLWFSIPVQGTIGIGMMLLGESVLRGGLGFVLLALFLLLMLHLALKTLRQRLTRVPSESAN